MWENASWLGVPHSELKKWNILEGDLTGRFAYYRLKLTVPGVVCRRALIRITANSCYRIWLNGNPVCAGPCRGDRTRTYYEEIDLSECGYGFSTRTNVLAVQVLYNNGDAAVKQSDERAAIFGVLTPGGGHRLLVEGRAIDFDGNVIADFTTGIAPWKVYLDGSFYLKSEGDTLNLGAVCEHIDFRRMPADWREEAFCDSDWAAGEILEPALQNDFEKAVGLVPRFCLKKRPIPLPYLEYARLTGELVENGEKIKGISSGDALHVPAHTVREMIVQIHEIANGYPRYTFRGGRDARVSVTYFEKFTCADQEIRRDDMEHGTFSGITDTFILNGEKFWYEPFRYRTFRYIAVRVETADEPAEVLAPFYERTGYPLQDNPDHIGSCTPETLIPSPYWMHRLYRICLNTLENCMMDTYMDCPYYEQMQFLMDTRLQMLFTYTVTDDTRLPEKAIEDLHCSITPEGLVCGKYPSVYPQIISTFSLHYIFMLLEYVQQTGNFAYVRPYLPDVDRILDYYDRKIGKDGLVGNLGYWQFVDWLPEWEASQGAPAALEKGPSTIINLMYAYALEYGAGLYEMAGRAGMAAEYRDRRAKILHSVHALCWDADRELYREGPDFEQYTCHAQAWAVLCGLPEAAGKADGDDGRGAGAARISSEAAPANTIGSMTNATPAAQGGLPETAMANTMPAASMTNVTSAALTAGAGSAAQILTHAAQDADVLKVSFSTAFEWFRACEKAGVYELTKAQMDLWRALPGKGCTCCPETPKNARSDCHGWSALPMYEMLRHKAFWETAYEK